MHELIGFMGCSIEQDKDLTQNKLNYRKTKLNHNRISTRNTTELHEGRRVHLPQFE
jgi:hypothetical protein